MLNANVVLNTLEQRGERPVEKKRNTIFTDLSTIVTEVSSVITLEKYGRWEEPRHANDRIIGSVSFMRSRIMGGTIRLGRSFGHRISVERGDVRHFR